MIFSLWKKLFYSPYFFTIAIRRRNRQDIITDPIFTADFVYPATVREWAADPILIDHEGKCYLFFESVHIDKGRIEVAEVLPDCSLSAPQVILESDCHYSYPFIFQHNKHWYMIPESSASNEVAIYRADEFPLMWEKERVLLDQGCVDTTVFELDGRMFLLTYIPCPGTERVTPLAYQMFWDDESIRLESVVWPEHDSLAVRGAGPIFSDGSSYYRPAQLSKEQEYGDAVLFFRVKSISDTYYETLASMLSADNVHISKGYFNGLHTYCRSRDFEAIDIRCREFDFFKIPRTIINRIFRRRAY